MHVVVNKVVVPNPAYVEPQVELKDVYDQSIRVNTEVAFTCEEAFVEHEGNVMRGRVISIDKESVYIRLRRDSWKVKKLKHNQVSLRMVAV